MFPESAVAKKFSLSDKKTSYLASFGLALYFTSLLEDLIKCEDFVLLFGESMNDVFQTKLMDFHVRFLDQGTFKTMYLTSNFLGHCTASDMVSAFESATTNLNLNNLIQLSMDGSNVNLALYKKIDTTLATEHGVTLINAGSCSFHKVHGACKIEDEKIMKWCLTIYHNTSIVDDNFPHLRLDIVCDFSSFPDAKVKICHLTALSTLANIIDEKESTEILKDRPDVIAFLVKKLGLAVKAPDHSHLEWSAQKYARTVCCLAKNDANKKLLVQMGCLPHLGELVKSGNVEEQREAVGAIHILAFEKENHRKILDDTKIIDLLIGIKDNSPDKVARKTVDGIFWNLREELQKNHYKQIVSTGTPVNDRRGHIMISYNWQHQKEVIKIRDILKEHGFSVWVDIDNMGGSVVDAFSKAVEDAHVILMCMSQKYKDSANCKSDVEYAYRLKKTIIPLKMESGYNPNGWLGYIAGIKLFFDFSGKYPFEEKIKELIHEIAICYGDEEP